MNCVTCDVKKMRVECSECTIPVVLCCYHNFLSFIISQVNRIKIPKQLDELVEMESESGNPVSKFFFRIKAEIHGVKYVHSYILSHISIVVI